MKILKAGTNAFIDADKISAIFPVEALSQDVLKRAIDVSRGKPKCAILIDSKEIIVVELNYQTIKQKLEELNKV